MVTRAGKHITEIIELDGFKTVSTKTKNKYLQYVSTLFDWAKRQGYTDNNYAEGFTLRVIEEDGRERFSKADLEKIFYSDEYMQRNKKKHKSAFRFWIPLISLFTGGRRNDLCQLRVEDIKEEEGIYYFDMNAADLNPNGERVGKTKAAKRKVPIHSLLIKLGFLNYVTQQRNLGEEMLFSGLK